MNNQSPPYAFILGCERSGSTWLSNVLDAHPDVEFFMEPFADYANIFPGFPSRNLYIESNNSALVNLVKDTYEKLPKIKYPLLYKPGKSPYQKVLDRFFVNSYKMACRALKCERAGRVIQFDALNLNSSKIPFSQQTRKSASPEVVVTKELRLNFKVGLLQRIYPDAKYIIIVRHPGAQIGSILKLFKKNSLKELKKILYSFVDYILNSTRFRKYHKLAEQLRLDSEIYDLLLLWWLINYETVIEDCEKYGVDFCIVYHEELSESPIDKFHQIFDFLGVDYLPEVAAYIKASSSKRHKVSSPVDTVRDSAKDYKAAISKIEPKMKQKIAALFDNVDTINELNKYAAM